MEATPTLLRINWHLSWHNIPSHATIVECLVIVFEGMKAVSSPVQRVLRLLLIKGSIPFKIDLVTLLDVIGWWGHPD